MYIYIFQSYECVCVCCCPLSGAGAPGRGRKTEDDFFLFSKQQGTGGERRKMPKPVSSSRVGDE